MISPPTGFLRLPVVGLVVVQPDVLGQLGADRLVLPAGFVPLLGLVVSDGVYAGYGSLRFAMRSW